MADATVADNNSPISAGSGDSNDVPITSVATSMTSDAPAAGSAERDLSSSAGVKPLKKRKTMRRGRSSGGLDDGDDMDGFVVDDIEYGADEYTEPYSIRSVTDLAQRAGFNPYAMSDEEKKVFPEYVLNEGGYLDIRNYILYLWKRNPKQYLSHQACMEKLQEQFSLDAARVFEYLERRGDINVGKFGNESLKKSPSEYVHELRALVVGAGAAGIMAARQLHQWGYKVTLIEARDRVGGRVWSERTKFTDASVDLGASIITGLIGNPLDNPHTQLNLRTKTIGENAALYFRQNGAPAPPDVDDTMDALFNELLDAAAKMKSAQDKYLGEELDKLIPRSLTAEQRGLLDWYYANLEYACAADLRHLSVNHWDQDDPYEFKGEHLMLCDGYAAMLEPLTDGIDVKLNTEICKVEYVGDLVRMHSSDGRVFEGDFGLITLPLGVLKDDWVKFEPPLPSWKRDAVKRLGFGLLNKVVLEFEEPFWDRGLDWFGSVNIDGDRAKRGNMYLFWNLVKFTRRPILTALIAGQASHDHELRPDNEIIEECLEALRKMYKLSETPRPTAQAITRWKSDRHARGSYSYIATGSSGDDYDILGRPIHDDHGNPKIFFAGEATNRYHPATVAGAYQSGIREAGRIHNIFCPLIPRPESSALVEARLNSHEEEKRKRHLRDIERSAQSRRPGLHRRRGMRRVREAVLGSGNQQLKFKYESVFGGAPQTAQAAPEGTSSAPAASAGRYTDFSKMFAASGNSSNNNTNNASRNRDGWYRDRDDQRRDDKKNAKGPTPSKIDLDRERMDKEEREYREFRDQRERSRQAEVSSSSTSQKKDSSSKSALSSTSKQKDDRKRSFEPAKVAESKSGGGRVFNYRDDPPSPPRSSQPPQLRAKFDPNAGLIIPDNVLSSLQSSLQSLSGQVPAANSEPRSQRQPSPSQSRAKKPKVVSDEARREFRDAVASLVVQRLTRFYKDGKLDREEFKHFSRKLTHKIIDKEREKGGSHNVNEKKQSKIKAFVDEYYKKKISSHRQQKSHKKKEDQPADAADDAAPAAKRAKLEEFADN